MMNITLEALRNATSSGSEDSTAWMTDSAVSRFILMNTAELRYLCMFAYCFLHGCKLFGGLKQEQSMAYKFVRMVFQCTGGGILVPIFINAVPVSLANDAYPIAIFSAFLLHNFFPILREVVALSPMLKAALIVLYESQRASVVVKLTTAAAAAIPASEFSFPLFGPIFCGSIAGCGGAFLPMDKGLSPLEKGLAPNMFSAMIAAASYHIFVSTSLSDGIPNAAKKAQFLVAAFFIAYGIVKDIGLAKLFTLPGDASVSVVKPEPIAEPIAVEKVATTKKGSKSKKPKKA